MKRKSLLILLLVFILLMSTVVSAGFFDKLFGRIEVNERAVERKVEVEESRKGIEDVPEKTAEDIEEEFLIKIFYETIQTHKPVLYREGSNEVLNFLRIQGRDDEFNVNAKKASDMLVLEMDSMLPQYNNSIISKWEVESEGIVSLGNLLATEEETELVVKQEEVVIGNGLDEEDIVFDNGVIVTSPEEMSSMDRLKLELPQEVLVEFEDCADLADSGNGSACERVIHFSSTMNAEGFAIMGGDVTRFTEDVWVVVESVEAEPSEPLCTDTDNGFDIYTKGKCVDETVNYDYCLRTGELKEFLCNGERCSFNVTDCPEGFNCHDGECTKQQLRRKPARNTWFMKILGRFLG